MTVKELRAILVNAEPEAKVYLGFDSGIRLPVETVAEVLDDEEEVNRLDIVLTDESEYAAINRDVERLERIGG